ncbi:hypothetical protein HPB47_022222, partial [Ixodes persulcatus]
MDAPGVVGGVAGRTHRADTRCATQQIAPSSTLSPQQQQLYPRESGAGFGCGGVWPCLARLTQSTSESSTREPRLVVASRPWWNSTLPGAMRSADSVGEPRLAAAARF